MIVMTNAIALVEQVDLLLPSITTGNRTFAVCLKICHVSDFGHTAKLIFAVCRRSSARQKYTHGKGPFYRVLIMEPHGKNKAHGKYQQRD